MVFRKFSIYQEGWGFSMAKLLVFRRLSICVAPLGFSVGSWWSNVRQSTTGFVCSFHWQLEATKNVFLQFSKLVLQIHCFRNSYYIQGCIKTLGIYRIYAISVRHISNHKRAGKGVLASELGSGTRNRTYLRNWGWEFPPMQ